MTRQEYMKKYREEHREKIKEHQRKYNRNHKEEAHNYYQQTAEKYKNGRIASKLKIAYNMTIEDYNDLFNNQSGCCAICGRHQKEFKQRLHVDHNHKTGEIRGLLCNFCNRAIGLFNDDIDTLLNAIEYLRCTNEVGQD